MKLSRFLTILAVLLSPGTAFGATDGSLGATSTGSSTVTVTVPNLIRITGISDIALGSFSGSGAMTGFDDVCIYTNLAAGTYQVTATGSGTSSAFTLASGGNTLAYSAYWNDTSGTNTGEAQLTATTPLTTQSGANTSSETCSGGTNARFRVLIAEAALLAAQAGSYTGTLTLAVEPM